MVPIKAVLQENSKVKIKIEPINEEITNFLIQIKSQNKIKI